MAIFEIYGYSRENLEVIMAIFEIIPIIYVFMGFGNSKFGRAQCAKGGNLNRGPCDPGRIFEALNFDIHNSDILRI